MNLLKLVQVFESSKGEDLVTISKEYFNTLNVTKGTRKPRQVSKLAWSSILYVKRLLENVDTFYHGKIPESTEKLLVQTYAEIEEYRPFLKERYGSGSKAQDVLKIGSVTYYKESSVSQKRFETLSKEISSFLGTLKGFHKSSIDKLVVRYKSASEMKAKAKYKQDVDEIWIRIYNKMPMGEEYASPKYIILHELGHRFLRQNKQSWDIDQFSWITTKYSGVDSMNGEEKFAELYAISHWPNKYSQYKEVIDRFLKKIQMK